MLGSSALRGRQPPPEVRGYPGGRPKGAAAQRGDWWGRPAGVWRPPWALSGCRTPDAAFRPHRRPPRDPTPPPCCLPGSGPKSRAAGDGRRLSPSREGPRPEEWRRRAVAGPAEGPPLPRPRPCRPSWLTGPVGPGTCPGPGLGLAWAPRACPAAGTPTAVRTRLPPAEKPVGPSPGPSHGRGWGVSERLLRVQSSVRLVVHI